MKDLVRFLARSSRRSLVLTFLVTAVGGLGMIGVLVMLRVFLVNPANADETWIAAFFGLGLVAVVARALGPLAQGSLSRTDHSRLVARLSRALLAAPLPILERWGERRIKGLFLEDAAAASHTMRALAVLAANVLILAGCLAVLGHFSGWLFLFGLCIAMLDVGSQFLFWGRQKKRAEVAYGDQMDLYDAYDDLIGGVNELKVHHLKREAFMQEVLRPALDSKVRGERSETSGGAAGSGGGWSFAAGGVVRLLFFLTIGVVLIGFPRWGVVGPGEVAGYVILFIFLMQPLEGIKLPVRLLSRANGALRRLSEFEAEAASAGEEGEVFGSWPGKEWKSIVLEGVEVRQERAGDPSATLFPGPLSAEIRQGELVVIQGGGARGKNTLARLLAGLLTPDAGRILVNGEEVTAALRENYRQLFSVVLADARLLPSLRGSDWLGSNALARRCAQLLGVEHLIQWNEGRPEFPRSPPQLSLTERRKLALLAAILEERPILIFDAGVAGSDPAFRDVFYRKIAQGLIGRGKTVVVIARDTEVPVEHRVIHVEPLTEPRVAGEMAQESEKPE